MRQLEVFFKGLWIGGTMTVPGVSGGTMAILVGIYDRLIYSYWNFSRFVSVFLALNSMKDRDLIHLCIPGIWHHSRHVVSAQYTFFILN